MGSLARGPKNRPYANADPGSAKTRVLGVPVPITLQFQLFTYN